MDKALHLLDYLIDCQSVFQWVNEIRPNGDKSELSERLDFIYDTYLRDNCSKPVMMSNQVLRDQLVLQLGQLKQKQCKTKFDLPDSEFWPTIRLLRDSTKDYKVWKGGVEQAYKQYLATRPQLMGSISAAVILTIL